MYVLCVLVLARFQLPKSFWSEERTPYSRERERERARLLKPKANIKPYCSDQIQAPSAIQTFAILLGVPSRVAQWA